MPGFGLQAFDDTEDITHDATSKNNYIPRRERFVHIVRNKKVLFFWIAMIVGVVAFEMRLVQLQIVQGAVHRSRAERNRLDVMRSIPARGIFFDRNGEVLAENIPHFRLIAGPSFFNRNQEDLARDINSLSNILDQDPEEILANVEKYENNTTNIVLIDGLTQQQAVDFSLMEHDEQTLWLDAGQRRFYPEGPLQSHILGYVGSINAREWGRLEEGEHDYTQIDTIGKTGLEQEYESILRGLVGKKYLEVDATGVEHEIISEERAQAGLNMTLSIDNALQEHLYNQILETHGPGVRAAAVALDPNTGAVRALVSVPSYDNNLFSSGITTEQYRTLTENKNLPLFNRAISAQYPSGSTIKPVVSLAALEEEIVTPSTRFLSNGGIRIDRWFYPDWQAGGHGMTNVTKAIAESVNTYYYMVGGGYEDFTGLGVARITDYFREFGMGSPLGLDIEGEAAGFLPSKNWKLKEKGEPWYVGDTYHLAIGQGDLLVTPLQVAAFTATVANGGTLYTPYLAENMFHGGGEIVWTQQPEGSRVPVKKSHIDTVRFGMRSTVLNGTAKSFQFLPLDVAAKTGTAQVGGDLETHAWFTAFAPYENPEIVIALIVENGGEGSVAAAPIVYNTLQWFAENRLQED